MSARREKARDQRDIGPAAMHAFTLDDAQGPLLLVGAIAGFMYLLRLGGAFPHPGDHLIGILCWAVLLGCATTRLVWEARQASFPVRWGGFFTLVIAFLLGVGLLVEVTVATDTQHNENQQSTMLG